MNDAFYDFDWPVAPRYEWREWLDKDGRPVRVPEDRDDSLMGMWSAAAVELTWNESQNRKEHYGPLLTPVVGADEESRRYHPMQREHAALFQEFADLDYRNQEAILKFASKYGSLGVPLQEQSIRISGRGGRWHHALGEPFLNWSLEICLMREGRQLSSRKLTDDTTERLKWLFDRKLQHVQGRLAFNPAGGPKLALEPLSLIAAMWLQLALAVTGEKQFVACKFCRRMFEISTDQSGFRSHREFCTDSCKTMDYRKRKRTALRLWESGMKISEIADKTKTEAATVRSWLGAAKGASRKR